MIPQPWTMPAIVLLSNVIKLFQSKLYWWRNSGVRCTYKPWSMSTSSGFPEGRRRINIFPGCGSQCIQPHRNICAENRSIIVVMTSFRERPRPPLPSKPFHHSRSGFNLSLSRLFETWNTGFSWSEILRGAPWQPGLPWFLFPSHLPIRCSLSHNRTPSIHSAVITRLELRSLYTFGMYTLPRSRDSLDTSPAIRSEFSASLMKSVSKRSRSEMNGTRLYSGILKIVVYTYATTLSKRY